MKLLFPQSTIELTHFLYKKKIVPKDSKKIRHVELPNLGQIRTSSRTFYDVFPSFKKV